MNRGTGIVRLRRTSRYGVISALCIITVTTDPLDLTEDDDAKALISTLREANGVLRLQNGMYVAISNGLHRHDATTELKNRPQCGV